MSAGEQYSPLGEVMDQIARGPRWRVRGPYRVADFVRDRTGGGPARNTWSDYFHGRSAPKPDTLRRFVAAFECDETEVAALAYARAFRDSTSGEPLAA